MGPSTLRLTGGGGRGCIISPVSESLPVLISRLLAYLMQILTIAIVPVIAWLIFVAVQDSRAMRRAGVGAGRSGCANCFYPLGGWSSSTCPECGTDVCERGVRVRSKAPRLILLIAVLAGSILVARPIASFVSPLVFHESHGNVHITYQLTADVEALVSLRLEYRIARFPRRRSTDATLHLLRSSGAAGASWIDGRWTGQPPRAERVFNFTDNSAAPDWTELRAVLAKISPDLPLEEARRAEDNLVLIVREVLVAMKTGTAPFDSLTGIPTGNGLTQSGSGYAMRKSTTWPAGYAPLLVMLACLVGGLVYVQKRSRHRPEQRAAHDGEWAATPAPDKQ